MLAGMHPHVAVMGILGAHNASFDASTAAPNADLQIAFAHAHGRDSFSGHRTEQGPKWPVIVRWP
jgi:hypothetical protein